MKGNHQPNTVRRTGLTDYATPVDHDGDYMSNGTHLEVKTGEEGTGRSKLLYHRDMTGGNEKRDLSPGLKSSAYAVEPASSGLPTAIHQESYEPTTTLRTQFSAVKQAPGPTPMQGPLAQRHRKVVKAKKSAKVGGNFAAFGPLELKHLFDTYNTSNIKDVIGAAAGHGGNPMAGQNPSRLETASHAATVRQPAMLGGRRIVALAQKSSLPRLPTTFTVEGSSHGKSLPP